MAAVSGALSASALLSTTVVDTVTLNSAPFYKVINRSAAVELWVTIGDGGATPADPTVLAANAYVIPAVVGSTMTVPNNPGSSATTKLKILGNANGYTIIGYPTAEAAR
jgi:hypothetical protein